MFEGNTVPRSIPGIANLGEISDQEFENHKLAFQASRKGKLLVLRDAPAWKALVIANLAYLDVAVALELWRSWKPSEFLHRLISEPDAEQRELLARLRLSHLV
ncbi:MAG: hypothetical protein J7M25_13590 [Deltaproteobacteria bacterium]|nr:hypothetical protein [Deltaproteobacteria bacterium]